MSDFRVNTRLSGGIHATAQIANVVEIPVAPDVYTGEYNVTAPSDGELVLPTKDKLMLDDLTINANQIKETVLLSLEPQEQFDTYCNEDITELREYALYKLRGFRVIKLPNVTSLVHSSRAITQTDAEEIYLPNISGQCWNGALIQNPNLRVLDFGKQIITNVLSGNPNLEILILRDDKAMRSAEALKNAGCKLSLGGDGGYVYVPQTLLAQYQASTSWQTNAHVLEFRPIEGSEYELEE